MRDWSSGKTLQRKRCRGHRRNGRSVEMGWCFSKGSAEAGAVVRCGVPMFWAWPRNEQTIIGDGVDDGRL